MLYMLASGQILGVAAAGPCRTGASATGHNFLR